MEEDEAKKQHPNKEGRAKVVPGCRAYWYRCDGEDDQGWGCGYRCCQMLVHQHQALRAWRKKEQDEQDDEQAHPTPTIMDIITAVNAESCGEASASSSSALPPLKWGEWMSLEHIIRFFRSLSKEKEGSEGRFEYFIFERLDRLTDLVGKMEDHLARHRSLIIAEGTGMLFCIGGLERRHRSSPAGQSSRDDIIARVEDVYVYILDPHGPPTTWSGEEDEEQAYLDGLSRVRPPSFRFKGGVGWIALHRLLFGTCLEEFFAAFPERKEQIDQALSGTQTSASNTEKADDPAMRALYTDVMDVCGGWRFLFIHP